VKAQKKNYYIKSIITHNVQYTYFYNYNDDDNIQSYYIVCCKSRIGRVGNKIHLCTQGCVPISYSVVLCYNLIFFQQTKQLSLFHIYILYTIYIIIYVHIRRYYYLTWGCMSFCHNYIDSTTIKYTIDYKYIQNTSI